LQGTGGGVGKALCGVALLLFGVANLFRGVDGPGDSSVGRRNSSWDCVWDSLLALVERCGVEGPGDSSVGRPVGRWDSV